MLNVECVLLTGGKSRRMGQNKAALVFEGESILNRTRRLLESESFPVTVLGPEGKQDANPFAGPLAALADFSPEAKWIFVASCDMPLFDARIVRVLYEMATGFDAAIPSFGGTLQPLCGLYHSSALKIAGKLSLAGESRIMTWVSGLNVIEVNEKNICIAKLNSYCVRSANTPDEWMDLLRIADKP